MTTAENEIDPKLQLNKLEVEYNNLRQRLRQTMTDYYKQSISNAYISENSMIDTILRMKEIKLQYKELHDQVIESRGPLKWRFGDCFQMKPDREEQREV